MGGKDTQKAVGIPTDLLHALNAVEGGIAAFEEFPQDQAQDLAEWVVATDNPDHRQQRVAMVVELVVEHFAKLRRIDLTTREDPTP